MINIVNDSRLLNENDIFVLEEKGLPFLKDILLKKPSKIIVNYLISKEALQIIGNSVSVEIYKNKQDIINLLHNYYKLPQNIWAITGTNGKTSVAFFISQLLSLFKINNINIGTIGVMVNNKTIEDIKINNTTPSIFELYQIFDYAKSNNIENVVFEASSHGLDQGRIDGIDIGIAGITNFTQDHLDYHKNMDAYLEAKLLLFNKYLKGTAVINSDIPEYNAIKNAAGKNKIIDYGFKAEYIKIIKTEYIDTGFMVDLSVLNKNYRVLFPIFALFQVYNICAAVGFLIEKFNVDEILNKIPQLETPFGRMESVKNTNIYIDYAHTPDALEKILQTVKDRFENKKKIVVVFGCGGDRDKTKRPIMGKIASKLADYVIVTDDNPRTENADKIREEIIFGIDNKNKVIEIGDRAGAIKYAIDTYYPDCCIVIAGKGHENYQIIGDKKHYFSDKDIVSDLL